MKRICKWAIVVGALALLVSAPPALGNYAGANGRIYFGAAGATTWSINPDGSGAAQISDRPIAGPWARGGLMMVSENFSGGPADFTVSAADGTKIADVTVPDDGHNPSFTPDGKIVYDGTHQVCLAPPYPICYGEGLGIYVVNLDGSGNHKILDSGTSPIWSPVGGKLAYLGGSGTNAALFVANEDGSNPLQVAQGYFIESKIDWSPNGTRIAYAKESCTSRCSYDVWSARADGTEDRQLTFTDNQERSASWSPDGTKIAFVASNPDLSGNAGVFVMNADGSGITPLRGDAGYPYWRPLVNHRPECSNVTASPGAIWPPNHRLVTVTLGGATDPDGDKVDLVVTGVTANPSAGPGDALTGPAQNQARLKAERHRTYTLAYDAGDQAGGHCRGTVTVAVTHG
jgi:WD40 repeat protein